MTRRMALAALLFALALGGSSQSSFSPTSDGLARGFKQPPEAARPRVWWHWMNGNVTREGITLDLEWMKRVGIGGVQMFDANIGDRPAGQRETPRIVEKPIIYHSPEWKEMLRFAAAECDRLGLELTVHVAGGWSETGGPWVKPEEAMKKLVWSETRVSGPGKFSGPLAAPPSVNGSFQDLPRPPAAAPPASPDPTAYGDSAVVAYRLPANSARMADPKLTRSGGDFDPALLVDGDFVKTVALPVPEDGAPAFVQLEFSKPFTARAATIGVASRAMPNGFVQASQDGVRFLNLASLPGPTQLSLSLRTYAFPEMTARFFRVVFTSPFVALYAPAGVPLPKQYDVAEIELHAEPRIHRFHEQAGFAGAVELSGALTPAVAPGAAIDRAQVLDLTTKMGRDGQLTWDVPPGNWIVLRMGWSLTGQKNSPAPPEATGFEVDKLNRRHVESYLRGFLDPLAEGAGPYLGKSLRYVLIDSWEAGMQNWTEDMLAEFAARRGYDARPYLPVLTGRIVESVDVSERFLWDFRRTIADMLHDYHYALPAEILARRGLKLYGEAAGTNAPMFQDALRNKGRMDIPMGEFWVLPPGGSHRTSFLTDVREAASAAHIYGKPLVAAESFTSSVPGWNDPPSALKWLGDYYMSLGVNRFVIHTSVHQPFSDRRPGFTLGQYGQHYTRNNTWAEQSRGWIALLSRSSYLLQQGQFVADLAYYYGEGVPASVYRGRNPNPSPEPPAGFSYDYVNTEVLLQRMSVKDGRIVLPDGMSYGVLVLPDDLDQLTAPVARQIRDLVAAGATVVGPKPWRSPSLVGYPASDEEVRSLGNEVWGDANGRTILEHAYGKGKVYWGRPLAEVMATVQIAPDVEYSRPRIDTTLVWIHRRAGDTDVYFLANQKDRAEEVEVRLRAAGRVAELWHPETGDISPASYAIEAGRTSVPLSLGPHESVFVVLREPAASPTRVVARPVRAQIASLDGPWDVSFPMDEGAPEKVRLERLVSWTTQAQDRVKYFSGTATYTQAVRAPAAWFRPGARLLLDLGNVKEIAEVAVNGREVGLAWRPPFQVDVTGALRPGANQIEVRLTNLWANRMIGDLQPTAERRYTFSMFKAYKPDSPLLESGLLGPVTLSAETQP